MIVRFQRFFARFPLMQLITEDSFLFRYHLKDVIVGKIYFLLVRIKIKYMELAIVKRETTGTGDETSRESSFPSPPFHFIL